MKSLKTIIFLLLATTVLTGCLDKETHSPDSHSNNMTVTETKFSDDFKTFQVKVRMPDSLANISITDNPHIRITSSEVSIYDRFAGANMEPQLTQVKNVWEDELAKKKCSLLILADLNLPAADFDKQRQIILNTRELFKGNRLDIAFMTNGGVTEDFPLTDYVVDHNLRQPTSTTRSRIYRSILTKYTELQSRHSNTAMLVVSNGDVYTQNNTPIDPDHFVLQSQLLSLSANGGPEVYYANVGKIYPDGEYNEAKGVINQLCKNTHGEYYETFDGKKMIAHIIGTANESNSDYLFCFTNPDLKVYNGKNLHLDINVLRNDSLITTACYTYTIGTVLNPIVVNGLSITQTILQGLIFTIFIAIIVYLFLQFVLPYISYRIFKRKYVVKFTKPNAIYRNIRVGELCYYCKAPFIYGEDVVVKCEHVMHKECWDENGYHCPEHGRKCPNGSHYYNENNLLDKRNAPYYVNWVFAALVAAFVSWALYMINSGDQAPYTMVNPFMQSLHDTAKDSQEIHHIYDNYVNLLYRFPFLGMTVNTIFTLVFAFLAHTNRNIKIRIGHSVAKAIVAGIAGYCIFMIASLINIVLDINKESVITDWLQWFVSSLLVVYLVSYRTRIMMQKKVVLVAAITGIVNTIMWVFLVIFTLTDSRELLLYTTIFYGFTLAILLAFMSPKSERYYLHMEGCVKTMDIALYKWMKTSPGARVTLGRSVDCNLQITWDIRNNIAPVQAEIFNDNGCICLRAIEEGVTVKGKPLSPDATIQLLHGKQFTIGGTTFTYEEKDI